MLGCDLEGVSRCSQSDTCAQLREVTMMGVQYNHPASWWCAEASWSSNANTLRKESSCKTHMRDGILQEHQAKQAIPQGHMLPCKYESEHKPRESSIRGLNHPG